MRIEVFVRGMNGHLVQRTWCNGKWSGWNNLGGDLASAPAAISLKQGHIEVFVRGRNHHLVQRSYRNGSWGGWKNLGGDLTAAPSAAAFGPDGMHIFVRGMNGHLVQRSWNGSLWSGWRNLGGDLTSAPAAVTYAGSKLDVFVRGKNDHLVRRRFLDSAWVGWENLGGDLRGHLWTRLKVLTHNVYGVKKDDCEERADKFGYMVAHAEPPYEIVGVQEYYGHIATCNPDYLKNAIWSTGRYKNTNNYRLFRPKVRWRANGGIGIFTLFSITKFAAVAWDKQTNRWPKASEGFIFARIKVPNSPIIVDVYVVHVGSGKKNRDKRRSHLEQLAKGIHERSQKSGNPVIVMGDFNIGGPPTYYGVTPTDHSTKKERKYRNIRDQ
jgi:endonuclease/exonuclease/phosphatase family metal-dependent hydrolase